MKYDGFSRALGVAYGMGRRRRAAGLPAESGRLPAEFREAYLQGYEAGCG